MSTTISCPACGADLALSTPVPTGKKVRCVHCQAVFTPGASGIVDAEVVRPLPQADPERPLPPPTHSRAYDDMDPQDRRRRPSREDERRDFDENDRDYLPRKKKSGGSSGLILGLSLGAGALVLIAAGVVLMVALRKGAEAEPGPVPAPAPGTLQGVWDLQGGVAPERITIGPDLITTDFGLLGLQQRYRMVDDRTIELDFHKFPPDQRPAQGFDHKVRFTIVSVTRDELVYVDNFGQQKKYRRGQ